MEKDHDDISMFVEGNIGTGSDIVQILLFIVATIWCGIAVVIGSWEMAKAIFAFFVGVE